MTTKIALALLSLVSFTHASSWTDKDRERNYKSETCYIFNPDQIFTWEI